MLLSNRGMRYDPPKLISVKALARWLKVDADWIQSESEAGRLPHVRAGRDYLFDPDRVEQILLERAQQFKEGGCSNE